MGIGSVGTTVRVKGHSGVMKAGALTAGGRTMGRGTSSVAGIIAAVGPHHGMNSREVACTMTGATDAKGSMKDGGGMRHRLGTPHGRVAWTRLGTPT